MKVTEHIKNRMNRLPKGYVFTYKEFISDVSSKEAVIKCLNRMATSGLIKKLSRGKFYKPEETPFGSLPPEQYQIVKDLLEKNGKLIGYITGTGIYNHLGLTSQVSSIIQIGTLEFRPPLKRGRYTITFIKQKNNLTKENIPLLQVLDAIRYIKKIPDTSIDKSCKRLTEIIRNTNDKEKDILIRLSLKYPPSTRALLGAILETLDKESLKLFASLNPITNYNIGISEKTLPTKQNWNIL